MVRWVVITLAHLHAVYEDKEVMEDRKQVEQQQFIPCKDSAGYGCAGFCQYGLRCKRGPNGCTCGSKLHNSAQYPCILCSSNLISTFTDEIIIYLNPYLWYGTLGGYYIISSSCSL